MLDGLLMPTHTESEQLTNHFKIVWWPNPKKGHQIREIIMKKKEEKKKKEDKKPKEEKKILNPDTGREWIWKPFGR